MKHDGFPGLDVTLTVDGNLCMRSGHVNEELCCFVEATSNKNFAISLAAHHTLAADRQDRIHLKVYLDGKYITGMIYPIESGFSNRDGVYRGTLRGHETNTSTGRAVEKFTFAELKTNDGPTDIMEKRDYQELGQVRIECTWGRKVSESYTAPVKNNFVSDAGLPILEKMLKGRAISNKATLGKAEFQAGSITQIRLSYPYGSDPFASFTFKYRSRRDLQIEGMIPRSPSPLPLDERDPATLSHAEAIELLRRRNRERENLGLVKNEKRERSVNADDDDDDDDDDDALEITGYRSKRRHTSDDSAVDVVDLTGD